jgi:glycosyltransferase involved in cell wall biosynthesis
VLFTTHPQPRLRHKVAERLRHWKQIFSAQQIRLHLLAKHPSYAGFELVPDADLELAVVIPVYRERDFLFNTIEFLLKCSKPSDSVEIIFVFNSSEVDSQVIEDDQKETANLLRNNYMPLFPQWLKPLIIEAYHLPKKHFGAGLARKIGMDAALSHVNALNIPDGIIVSLDADTLVQTNYFTAISKWFSDSKRNGAGLYYEHPLSGNAFAQNIYEGIIKYELHLRYYTLALRYVGFPYAFHTMGSAMAFRAQAYARIGGMPRRQAGEDFYFLQKLIPLGRFGEINETTIFPSPRPSDRVIFGTGAAITKHVSGDDYVETTYNFQAYEDLKVFLQKKNELFEISATDYERWTYELSGPMRSYLLNSGFFDDLDALKKDCSTLKVFSKRFFEVFNAFRVVKYLNYVHDHFFAKMGVFDAAVLLLDKLDQPTQSLLNELDALTFCRQYERENSRYITETV